MKVNLKKIEEKFKQRELIITIESQKELDNLKNLFGNSSPSSIKKSVSEYCQKTADNLDLPLLSNILSQLHRELI